VPAIIRKNGFILALLAAVLLAYLAPGLGARDGVLHAGFLTKAGVMVIFLLQGLSLKTRELAGGLRQIRLHAFVQAWIFLFSPVLLVLAALLLKALSLDALAAGFLYLALIPTTISSAVAFTGAAGGNVPASIFNTTVSNVFGVFWVPTGCLLIFASGGGFDPELVLPLLLQVAELILLPLVVGQLLRPIIWETKLLKAVSPSFRLVNHGIILFIVYAAFCQSFLSDAWSGTSAGSLILLVGLVAIVVGLVHLGVWKSSQLLFHDHKDRIAALFCGSQKTLAAGAPMALAIFSNGGQLAEVNLGLLILPLLVYHPAQLLLGALILPKLGH
jgi:sodium/bile acid cotransporter 7